jgi:hypothetical protein
VQAVLELVPDRGPAQGLLDLLLDCGAVADPAHAHPVGHVFEDALRKRVGLLKDHPDPHPHLHRVDLGSDQVHLVGVQDDLALVLAGRIEGVHAVEAAQQRALAAARWTN